MSARERIRSALFWTLLLSAAACGGGEAVADRSPEGNRTAREITWIQMHEDSIRRKLRDPEAATFRGSRIYYGTGPVVCGEVNAPNAFGGKVGFQRFIASGPVQIIEEEMAQGEMQKAWNQLCTNTPPIRVQ